MRFEDLTGKQFGMLTPIKRVRKENSKQTYWLCKCRCGNETITTSAHLKDGHTKSCGCLQTEVARKSLLKHGLSKHPLYKIYRGIIDRTLCPSNSRYANYGGRGIRMCDEWLNSFQNFYKWAIDNGYEKGLTIDRINPNGDYEPNNCRWATWKEQENNRTNNRFIRYGNETHTMSEWSAILGIRYTTLAMRLNRYGWDTEKAFSTPTKGKVM